MATKHVDLPPVRELSREEARAIFEAEVAHRLGIDVGTFLQRLQQGMYRGTNDPDVDQVLMLLPLIDVESDGESHSC